MVSSRISNLTRSMKYNDKNALYQAEPSRKIWKKPAAAQVVEFPMAPNTNPLSVSDFGANHGWLIIILSDDIRSNVLNPIIKRWKTCFNFFWRSSIGKKILYMIHADPATENGAVPKCMKLKIRVWVSVYIEWSGIIVVWRDGESKIIKSDKLTHCQSFGQRSFTLVLQYFIVNGCSIEALNPIRISIRIGRDETRWACLNLS